MRLDKPMLTSLWSGAMSPKYSDIPSVIINLRVNRLLDCIQNQSNHQLL